jgi:small subunit ribosomal protein S6
MDNAKRLYETTFIVNASLDDTQIDTVIARVQDTITKNGGTVESVLKWGRKRLAYTINKKTNGFYANLEFTGPSTLLAHLDRSYQLDEQILRHLTLVLDPKAVAARARAMAAPATALPPTAPPAVPAREPLFKESGEEPAIA